MTQTRDDTRVDIYALSSWLLTAFLLNYQATMACMKLRSYCCLSNVSAPPSRGDATGLAKVVLLLALVQLLNATSKTDICMLVSGIQTRESIQLNARCSSRSLPVYRLPKIV